MPNLILASKSPHRQMLLDQAGIEFNAYPANIDERAIEISLSKSDITPSDLALILSLAKAQDVSSKNPDAYIIGSDQTLSLEGEMFHKPADMDGARRHLLKLSGKTHELNSAIAIVRNGEIIWEHVSVAYMTMRKLSPTYIGHHLAKAGEDVLTSVGAYQLEKEGVLLFEKIEGDFFTIVGLPMLPLLKKLRELEIIDG